MRRPLTWLHDRRFVAAAALCLLVAATAPTGVLPLSHLPGVWRLPDRWTEARAGWLYRSSWIPASDVADVLQAKHIDVVIDLTEDRPDHRRDAERAAAEQLGVRFLHIPVVHPTEVVISSLATVVAEIARAHQQGERVLVHCTYGYRRSATALALYARVIEHEPPHIAYAELTRYSDANSSWSPGVVRFLDRNIDELRAQVAAKLAEPEAR